MSIFSRLAKNLKRALRTVAPIVAPILGTILPGVGGILAGAVISRGGGGGGTPGIAPPLPGAGSRAATIERQAIARRARSEVVARQAAARRMRAPSNDFLTGGRRVITPSAQVNQMSIFAGLPALGRAVGPIARTIGRGLTGRTAGAAGLGVALGQTFGDGDGACPSGWHLNKQDGVGGPAGTYCVRNRRMNFGNARSARRSVRRLKGARKLLKDIERMMPTKTRTKVVHADHHAHHS